MRKRGEMSLPRYRKWTASWIKGLLGQRARMNTFGQAITEGGAERTPMESYTRWTPLESTLETEHTDPRTQDLGERMETIGLSLQMQNNVG